MRRLRSIAVLAFALFISTHALRSQQIELVESVPVGTILDNPDIRNADAVWVAMIDRARASLDIEQFYISTKPGEPMDAVIAAVTRAAKRGVHVRVIVDARMYKTYPHTVDTLGAMKNCETRLIDFSKIAGGIQHAKYFIVDRKEVFFGSQNFDWRALKHIHELGFRIDRKDAARFYGSIFDADWKLAGGAEAGSLAWNPPLFPKPQRLIQKNKDTLTFFPTCSPIGVIPDSAHWDEPNIIRIMDNAKHEIVMQFLSYSPEARKKGERFALSDAVRRAAERGVRVKIIVSDWQKETRAEKDLKELSTVANVELKFSAIPDWEGGYVSFGRVEHCKYILCDGREFWLGTSNAERGYFHESRNLGIIIRNRTLGSRLHDIFMMSWSGPYTEKITKDGTYAKRKHDGE